MTLSSILLIILLVLCIAEIIIGVVRHSRFLVATGIIFSVMLILALILTLKYADALYISDPGHIL